MKHLEINFDNLVVGQKVWSILHGELVIANLEKTNRYPITVVDSNKQEKIFTIEGKYHLNHTYPALFLSNPFEQVSEFPKVMEVSDNNYNWYKRVVVIADNKYYFTRSNIESIAEVKGTEKLLRWAYAREVQIHELTLKDIADKFGISVDSIRIKE